MNAINKLEQVLNKYDGICEREMQNIHQIFIDFIETALDKFHEYKEKDYSEHFIKNDFIGSLQYDISNILEIAKDDVYCKKLFTVLSQELTIIKTE